MLPLRFSKDQSIAVVGPNANNMYALWGDYASRDGWGANVTAREAAEAEVGAASVAFAPGCADTFCANASGFERALAAAASSKHAIIAVMGTQGWSGPSSSFACSYFRTRNTAYYSFRV